MSASALGRAAEAGRASATTFAWPADDDPLRLPRGPICDALIASLLRGGPAVADPSWVRQAVASAGPRLVLPAEAHGADASPAAVGPLTLDVALVVLDQLVRGAGAAPVNARLFLARKGYRRWGGERHAFEGKILAQLRLLSRFLLRGDGGGEPLLRLEARNVARTDFIARAGPALALDLQGATWTELPNEVLRLDHRQNRGGDVLAKKAALLLALDTSGSRPSVAQLLMRLGHPPSAHGARERLLEALGRLRALGVLDSERELRFRATGSPNAPPRFTAVPSAPEAEAVNRRRGRPAFDPKPSQRHLVRTLFAHGATREQIARAVGVSLPTLRRYFAAEIGRSTSLDDDPPIAAAQRAVG